MCCTGPRSPRLRWRESVVCVWHRCYHCFQAFLRQGDAKLSFRQFARLSVSLSSGSRQFVCGSCGSVVLVPTLVYSLQLLQQPAVAKMLANRSLRPYRNALRVIMESILAHTIGKCFQCSPYHFGRRVISAKCFLSPVQPWQLPCVAVTYLAVDVQCSNWYFDGLENHPNPGTSNPPSFGLQG